VAAAFVGEAMLSISMGDVAILFAQEVKKVASREEIYD
jgi:hypothetical protein